MRKSSLGSEHIAIINEYGLGSFDHSQIWLSVFESGEFILRQGYACPYVYIMVRGKAKVFVAARNGKALLICYYSSKVILGEVELALGSDAAVSNVQAITEVSCICIPRERYQKEMKGSALFMNAVSTDLAQKLFYSDKSSMAAILQPLEPRLCAYIVNTSGDGYFRETLTETAEILGTSYRHLLRTLENLRRSGIIEKTAKGYLIKNMAKLKLKGEDK